MDRGSRLGEKGLGLGPVVMVGVRVRVRVGVRWTLSVRPVTCTERMRP